MHKKNDKNVLFFSKIVQKTLDNCDMQYIIKTSLTNTRRYFYEKC